MASGAGGVLNAILVFGGDASKATTAINQVNQSLTKLNSTLSNTSKSSTRQQAQQQAGATNLWKTWQSVFSNMGKAATRFIDGLRLMTQGIMSVGRALTFFVSIPLGIFLKTAGTMAMDFEDGMIRVAKTTGMSSDQLAILTENIRDLAARAPTSHVALAAMAEQAGQLGIIGVEAISEFVEWMEIMATSTNIAGDEVVSVMGKISAAFGWDLNVSREEVIRLSNVMNELENSTAATAGEIADALFRFAPIAKSLNIAAADAAALSAALISLGVSAESTGTRLGNMYIKLTQNSDKFADLVQGAEKYATQQDVLNAINEDAVVVLHDLIVMMAEEDNRAKALAQAFDLVGLRGGRALVTLSGGLEVFRGSLESARVEWSEAASLITEYNRQLDSAKSHLEILKNNLNNVGIELANTFFPVMKEVIQFLVPGLRMLTDAFSRLSDKTKMIIIGSMMLIVALGPLIFLFSQIAFGIMMFSLGVIKLGGAVAAALSALGGLVKILMISKGALLGVVGAIVTLGVAVLKVLSKMGVDVAGFFARLGEAAVTWGENLAAQIANGFVAGAVRYITQAIQYVANLIASFFAAHSPPKAGPLSHIDKWGKALIDTYFKSMTKADFSILKNLSQTIGNIFATLAKSKIIGEKQQFIYLLQARQDLAKLLSIWRETGKLSEKVLNDVVKNLRSAKDEVKKLIEYEFEVLRIEEALADLERQRVKINSDYAEDIDDIAASGKSAAERVDLIRKATRARNDELKKIDKEEKALEEQKLLAEEQLETQKAMIDAMQEQDDIQLRLLDTLKKLASAVSGLGDGLEFPAGGIPFEVPDIGEELKKLGTPIIEFELKVKSKKGLWDALIMGLKGEELPAGDLSQMFPEIRPEDWDAFFTLYDLGSKVNSIWRQVVDTFNTVKTAVSDFATGEESPFGDIDIEGIKNKLSDMWNSMKTAWGEVAGFVGLGVQFIVSAFATLEPILRPTIDAIIDGWKRLTSFLGSSDFISGFTKVIGVVIGILSMLVGLIIAIVASLIGAITEWVGGWFDAWDTLFSSTATFKEKLLALFTILTGNVLELIVTFLTNMATWFQNIFESISGTTVPAFFTSITTSIWNWITSTIAAFITFVGSVISTFASIANAIGSAISAIPGVVSSVFSAVVAGIKGAISVMGAVIKGGLTAAGAVFRNFGSVVLGVLVSIGGAIVTRARAFMAGLATAVRAGWNTVKQIFNGFKTSIPAIVKGMAGALLSAGKSAMQGLINGIKSMTSKIMAAVQDIVNKIKKKISDALKMKSPSRVMFDFGENIGTGLAEGIASSGRLIEKTLEDTLDRQLSVSIGRMDDPFLGGFEGAQQFNVNIEVGQVRDDRDIEAIAKAVKNVLDRNVRYRSSYGY